MKTVCAAIIRENGMIFISNRPPDKAAAGKWEFPGGKVESGERFSDCIVREMKEELSMNVLPLDVVFDFVHTYPTGSIRLVFLRCLRLDQGEILGKEGQNFCWIPIEDLVKYDFLEADRSLCELLIYGSKCI